MIETISFSSDMWLLMELMFVKRATIFTSLFNLYFILSSLGRCDREPFEAIHHGTWLVLAASQVVVLFWALPISCCWWLQNYVLKALMRVGDIYYWVILLAKVRELVKERDDFDDTFEWRPVLSLEVLCQYVKKLKSTHEDGSDEIGTNMISNLIVNWMVAVICCIARIIFNSKLTNIAWKLFTRSHDFREFQWVAEVSVEARAREWLAVQAEWSRSGVSCRLEPTRGSFPIERRLVPPVSRWDGQWPLCLSLHFFGYCCLVYTRFCSDSRWLDNINMMVMLFPWRIQESIGWKVRDASVDWQCCFLAFKDL